VSSEQNQLRRQLLDEIDQQRDRVLAEADAFHHDLNAAVERVGRLTERARQATRDEEDGARPPTDVLVADMFDEIDSLHLFHRLGQLAMGASSLRSLRTIRRTMAPG
jgi:hypothetical protein